MCVIVQNFVLIGQTVVEKWRFVDLCKMATVRHLEFLLYAHFDHSQRVFCAIYHCAKFG